MELYLKLDPIARLRRDGGGREPNPLAAAMQADLGGVHGLTVHLRPEHSPIQVSDIRILKEAMAIPLNLEIEATNRNRQEAFTLRPDSVTLVRDPRDDAADRWPVDGEESEPAASFCQALADADIRPGAFIKAALDSVKWASRVGARFVILDTTVFNRAKSVRERDRIRETLFDCARLAGKLGMDAHLAGGVDYRNMGDLLGLPVQCLHVGNALAARAVLVGMERAVERMLHLMEIKTK